MSDVRPGCAAANASDGGVSAGLGELAALVREATSAFVCAVAWDAGDSGGGVVFAPERCGSWHEPAEAVLAALARRAELSDRHRSARIAALPKAELAALLAGDTASAAAFARKTRANRVRIALLAPIDRSARELEKIADLACRAALGPLGDREHTAAREFWRAQGADSAEKYSRANAALAACSARERAIADLIQRTRALRVRDRFATAGNFLARSGPFEQWMIALATPHGAEIVASSASTKGAAGETARLRELLERAIAMGDGKTSPDALHHTYVCVPFESGALAMWSRAPLAEAKRAQHADLVARLAPILNAWRLELELESQRLLTRRMAYRMFNAVAEERARIARDLHDDHAQLITATRVALQGGGDQARAILQRIEHEVRRKLRELKPASLGRMSLARALSLEAARLNRAGIETTLSGAAVAARLSRPAQNLCWQVAREALANVIRHSHATRVELSLARKDGFALIAVTDNGRGIAAGALERGSGISGMRERVSLIGGSVHIDSRPGATVLTAEIPDPL